MFRLLRSDWLYYCAGMIVGLIMLNGCGYNGTQNATNSGSPLTSASSARTTASGIPQLTSPHGPVTITLNAPSYRVSDSITVTLSNHGDQAIFFVDQHTNCTVLVMQQRVDGNWQSIENCYVGRRSLWSTLNPEQQLQVKLDPPRGKWLPGRYRVTLDYSTGKASYSFSTLSSVDFQVEAS